MVEGCTGLAGELSRGNMYLTVWNPAYRSKSTILTYRTLEFPSPDSVLVTLFSLSSSLTTSFLVAATIVSSLFSSLVLSGSTAASELFWSRPGAATRPRGISSGR